ncbi:hypothetical protein [Mycoplasma elephantis]|uniref:hypothetical protein n=1 Tax=Mycoplasma elephantis TaxID=114882 RepID=UPI00048626BC|nr:hypothetical protein [Mycoplasma elephantis]
MNKNDNYYIFEFDINNKLLNYAIKFYESISDIKYEDLDNDNKLLFLENAIHRITIDFFFNFNQLPDNNFYIYIPTYYYEIKNLTLEGGILKLWYFREIKTTDNFDYSIKNVDFNWENKKNCTEALVEINKDISRFLGSGNYYIRNTNMIGDFKLEHFSDIDVSWLDYEGIIDLENYPFFKLIDWSKIKRNHKRFVFQFNVPETHEFKQIRNCNLKLILTIKSQFETKGKIQDYQIVEDLKIHDFKTINELIYFKKDVLEFKELNKFSFEKVIIFIKEFNNRNKINLPNDFIDYVKKGFKKHANFLKSNILTNNLKDLIVGEYLENDFYFFANDENAFNYALINYFYHQNKSFFPESSNFFDKGLLLFQYIKNVDLLDDKTNSITLWKHDWYSKLFEIFNFFVYENNDEIYKKWFYNGNIFKI